MKDFIRKMLKEGLEEISTKQKSIFGSGMEHNVYSSKQHPDRLYKIGSSDTVGIWVRIFKENPKVFPKIYRVFPSKQYSNATVVEIEKLEIEKAEAHFRMVRDILTHFMDDKYGFSNFRLQNIHQLDTNNIKFTDFIKAFKDWLINQRYNVNTITLCLKWVKMVYQMYSYFEKKYHYIFKDIHAYNVAYDKMGNIKIIDI